MGEIVCKPKYVTVYAKGDRVGVQITIRADDQKQIDDRCLAELKNPLVDRVWVEDVDTGKTLYGWMKWKPAEEEPDHASDSD